MRAAPKPSASQVRRIVRENVGGGAGGAEIAGAMRVTARAVQYFGAGFEHTRPNGTGHPGRMVGPQDGLPGRRESSLAPWQAGAAAARPPSPHCRAPLDPGGLSWRGAGRGTNLGAADSSPDRSDPVHGGAPPGPVPRLPAEGGGGAVRLAGLAQGEVGLLHVSRPPHCLHGRPLRGAQRGGLPRISRPPPAASMQCPSTARLTPASSTAPPPPTTAARSASPQALAMSAAENPSVRPAGSSYGI